MEIGSKPIKLNWKQRILSAILTAGFYMGLLSLFDYFTEDNLYSINSLIFQGVTFGIFMGIGFPYITEKFGKRFTSTLGKNIQPELSENEAVEIEGPANLFRGVEGVGGKLFLTDKKMIFKAHKINIQKGQTDIPYHIISKITKRKTAKLIDNGLRINTSNGNEYDFVVNDRGLWVEKLNEKLTK